MSAGEITGAQLCGDLECPIGDDENVTLPVGCIIPYGSAPSEYCTSVKVGLISQALVVLVVAIYMIGVGASMELEKAKHALKNPKPPMVGLFCQVFLNPLVMFGVLAIFGEDFPLSVRITTILIASAPGGNGSALLTLLAYGSVELSVAMTIFSTFFSFATFPFWVWMGTQVIWADEASSLDIDFLSIALAALIATLLPMFGLALKYKVSQKAAHYFATYGTAFGVVGTIIAAFLYLADPLLRAGLAGLGWQIWICGILLNGSGLAMGYTASRLARFPHRFHRTIAFEVGSQNIAIPLGIITVSYGGGPVSSLFIPFIGVYAIASLPTNYGMMLFWRFCDPIHEPHHDGYDEEEEKELDKEFGLSTSSASDETSSAS